VRQPKLLKQFLEQRDVILGFILALTRDYDVAEEIFQEVALAILEEGGKETEVEKFSPWAREVARRRVAEYYRKQTRRQGIEQLSESMEEMACQAFAENERTLETHGLRMKYLLECLELLTGRSRDVIEGFYRDRKSLREIASGLRWGENSVKVALSRARKALGDCIHAKLRVEGAA
jgi:RNA polymerase sigma-70 factor (ECF subfamily)